MKSESMQNQPKTLARACVRFLALATAGVLFLAGCGSGTSNGASDDESGSADAEKITLQFNFVASGLMADYFLTKGRGYYADEGLNVEILEGKGTVPTLEAVAAKKTTIGDVGCAQLAAAVSEGRPLISIGMRNGRPSFGFFVDKDSDIQEISDLRGKTFILPPGTPQANLSPAIFDRVGVDMDSEIDVLGVQAAQQLSTYARGKGDTIATSVPFAEPVINPKRPSRTLMWSDEGFEMPDYCFVVHRDTLESEPEMLQGFLEATYRGRTEAKSDPKAAVDLMMKEFPQLEASVVQEQLELHFQFDCSTGMERLGVHDPAAWKEGIEVLKEYAALPESVQAADLYTNDLIDEIETAGC